MKLRCCPDRTEVLVNVTVGNTASGVVRDPARYLFERCSVKDI
jgi:hypothetical protein